MRISCATCGRGFDRSGAVAGDAVMCPSCRTLVVVEVPVGAEPLEEMAPVRVATRPSQPRPKREPTALLRACPACGVRYPVDQMACRRCGRSHVRARMARDDAKAAAEFREEFFYRTPMWRVVIVVAAIAINLAALAITSKSLVPKVLLVALVAAAFVWRWRTRRKQAALRSFVAQRRRRDDDA